MLINGSFTTRDAGAPSSHAESTSMSKRRDRVRSYVARMPKVSVHEIGKPGHVMQDESVRVTSTLVKHPPIVPAFGHRFDFKDRSIAFSGNTVPLEAVALSCARRRWSSPRGDVRTRDTGNRRGLGEAAGPVRTAMAEDHDRAHDARVQPRRAGWPYRAGGRSRHARAVAPHAGSEPTGSNGCRVASACSRSLQGSNHRRSRPHGHLTRYTAVRKKKGVSEQ